MIISRKILISDPLQGQSRLLEPTPIDLSLPITTYLLLLPITYYCYYLLPRDAMRKRGVCRGSVSVRPSVTYPIPRGTAGAQNTSGWENFVSFDRNRRLSRKRYEIGP